jgi:hypothetical protein
VLMVFVDGHVCLKQQLSITVHRLLTEKNKLMFSVSVCSKQMEVCRFCFPFAENKRELLFYVSSVLHIFTYIYAAISNEKRRMDVQPIFLNLFTVCSSCRHKFVICLFIDLLTKKQTEVIHLQTH